ncbi:MAG: AMP-binding protein [Ferruginibacter sp.]|nr:AMP-binding protein [Ferruginibacter sp.]
MIFQHELIRCLHAHRDKVAIDMDGEQTTYSQLLKKADKITFFLLEKECASESAIGILSGDVPLIISAMIGIANARCQFVPLDPSMPARRQEHMFGELQLKYIITSRAVVQQNVNSLHGADVYFIEDILAGISEEQSGTLIYPEYEEEDSLYVYFTSGTTGMPKGIIGKNASLVQFLKWEIEEFDIHEGFRFSQFISPYFDAFLRDVFVPLFTGGIICIPENKSDILSPELITPWLNRNGINFIHCVPSLFRLINNKNIIVDDYPLLKYVLLSGEKIIPGELVNWYSIFSSRIQLVNLYGATETTMIRSFYRINPQDTAKTRIPIGKPIAGTSLLILSAELKPCNTLVAGDLYISSQYVSKGYLNNADLTNARFLKIPSREHGEITAFKTGDKARKLTDGNIDLIGREDRQVKLRGVRVELDAIEYVLCESDFVKNAVVIKEECSEEYLVAYVIISSNELPAEKVYEELRNYLAHELPDYMIPADIIIVESFPLLSNGKIDYKTLQNSKPDKAIEPPANSIEEKLLHIWHDILGKEKISVTHEFQRIGGNSLTIMRLIARIYNEFSVKITLSGLFKNLTIQKQAAYIQLAGKDKLMSIQKTPVKEFYHTSLAQERMYYDYFIQKDNKAYNLPMAIKINGKSISEKIKKNIRLLVQRHESLRTGFKMVKGKLVQFILDDVDFFVNEINAEGKDAHVIINDFVQPFNLEKPPLLRCVIIQLTEEMILLVIDIHHIICDGISQMNLEKDFMALFNEETLNPVTYHYKDYTEWEFAYRATADYKALSGFWMDVFKDGIPKLKFPSNHNASDANAGNETFFLIEKSAINEIMSGVADPNITMFSVLLSIYFIYLSEITGQLDLVVGIAASGRMHAEFEDTIGMFVKTLPIRYKVDTEAAYKYFLQGLHQYLIEAGSRQLYDLADMLSDLNVGRSEPVKNIFDTMFTFQNYENNDSMSYNNNFINHQVFSGEAKYPFSMIAVEDKEYLSFRIEYSNAYFSDSDVQLLVGVFKNLVAKIAGDPNLCISSFIEEPQSQPQLADSDISFNF